MNTQETEQRMDLLLVPFIEAEDEAEAREHLEQLVARVTPLIAKITRRGNHPEGEDDFQESVRRVIGSLWACKADPVGRGIGNFEHYVSVLAKHACQGRIRGRQTEIATVVESDEEDGRSWSDLLPSPELQPDEEAEWKEFLEKLWAEIERLKPPQRLAYLLNFTDAHGQLDMFAFYGVASIRRIGTTLQLSDEQFSRLWTKLELSDEEHHPAASLKSHDERFALLWPYLPLNDFVIAEMLATERQDVINLRAAARRKLAKSLAALRPSSRFFL